MRGPMTKHPAAPANPAIVMNAVAVARSFGGNHRFESTGPAVKITGALKPISMCATCANLQIPDRYLNFFKNQPQSMYNHDIYLQYSLDSPAMAYWT